MQKLKAVCFIVIVFVAAVGGIFSVNSVRVRAATVSPTATATATRILHVIVKKQPTPTRTPGKPVRTVATPAPTLKHTLTATPTATAITGLGGSIEATVQAYIAQTKSITDSSSLNNTTAVTVAQPIRLVIPSLKVDVSVESVGKDKNGAMDVPARVEDVAWYALGSAPGQIGNAVIAGHLDLVDGSPAVFWNIGKLKPGDEVIVYDVVDTAYHFEVTGSQRYQYDSAPVEDIFGFSLKSQLNLITCAGTWNRTSRNYSNRLVIYTELVDVIRSE